MNCFNLANGGLIFTLVLLMPIAGFANLSQKSYSRVLFSELLKPLPVEDVPIPAEDVPAKPAKTKEPFNGGCLSESQIDTMINTLQEARNFAIKGALGEAVEKYNEFAGGLWDAVALDLDLKMKSPWTRDYINAKIIKIDNLLRGFSTAKVKRNKQLRPKFIREVTNLINAIKLSRLSCYKQHLSIKLGRPKT
jgi:hypothetical protein